MSKQPKAQPDATSTSNPEYYYRYVDGGDPHVGPQLSQHRVIRRTDNSTIVLAWDWMEKRIQNNWVKKFAYPTIAEARTAYIMRKRRQIRILTAQLEQATAALTNAEADRWDQIQPLLSSAWQPTRNSFDD